MRVAEESRQSSTTWKRVRDQLDDRLGIRGGVGSGPAGERQGEQGRGRVDMFLQFHVPIAVGPVSPWHGVPISRRLSIAVKLGWCLGSAGLGEQPASQ